MSVGEKTGRGAKGESRESQKKGKKELFTLKETVDK